MFYQYNDFYTNLRIDINTGTGWTQVGTDYRPNGANVDWTHEFLDLGVINSDFSLRFWTSIKYNLVGEYNNGVYIEADYIVLDNNNISFNVVNIVFMYPSRFNTVINNDIYGATGDGIGFSEIDDYTRPINITIQDNILQVDKNLCTKCNQCAEVCPIVTVVHRDVKEKVKISVNQSELNQFLT